MAEGRLGLPLRRPLPNSPCYVCRSCDAIVGWAEHLVSSALAIMPNCFILSNIQMGNAFVDIIPFERGVYRLRIVYCGVCFSLIGWKIAQTSGPLSTVFAEGRYILFGRSIYSWNGFNLVDPFWSLYGLGT